LVGTTTYGKGVAQQVSEFTDGSSMKLSMYYFLTPNKKRIDHVGITPDYTVQNSRNPNEKELAEKYAGFAPMSEKVKPKAGDVGLNVFARSSAWRCSLSGEGFWNHGRGPGLPL
jgi:carboxyl-terminal processing protease